MQGVGQNVLFPAYAQDVPATIPVTPISGHVQVLPGVAHTAGPVGFPHATDALQKCRAEYRAHVSGQARHLAHEVPVVAPQKVVVKTSEESVLFLAAVRPRQPLMRATRVSGHAELLPIKAGTIFAGDQTDCSSCGTVHSSWGTSHSGAGTSYNDLSSSTSSSSTRVSGHAGLLPVKAGTILAGDQTDCSSCGTMHSSWGTSHSDAGTLYNDQCSSTGSSSSYACRVPSFLKVQ